MIHKSKQDQPTVAKLLLIKTEASRRVAKQVDCLLVKISLIEGTILFSCGRCSFICNLTKLHLSHTQTKTLSLYESHFIIDSLWSLYPVPPSIGHNIEVVTFFLFLTSVISITVSHFECKHRCLIGREECYHSNMLSNRWRYCPESLRKETPSCL